MNLPLQNAILFLVVVWIWSSTWLAIRLGLNGVPPITGAAIRMVTSGLILLAIARLTGLTLPRGRAYAAHLAVQATLLFCVQYALLYWAEQTVPSGLAAVLFATVPMFAALFAGAIFGIERLSAVNVVGLALGFAGVVIIYWSEVLLFAHVPPLGMAACLVAAASSSFASVFAKRYAHDVPPLATVAPGQAIGGCLLWVLALAFERGQSIHFNAISAAALTYLIVFGSCVVFLCYFTLMRRMPVTRLTLIAYVIPIAAVTLGAIVGHERFSPGTFAGTGVILAGIGLVNLRQRAAVPATEP